MTAVQRCKHEARQLGLMMHPASFPNSSRQHKYGLMERYADNEDFKELHEAAQKLQVVPS